jgi:hypothetical protein
MSEPSVLRPSWLPDEVWEALDETERRAVVEGRVSKTDLHDLWLALRDDEQQPQL